MTEGSALPSMRSQCSARGRPCRTRHGGADVTGFLASAAGQGLRRGGTRRQLSTSPLRAHAADRSAVLRRPAVSGLPGARRRRGGVARALSGAGSTSGWSSLRCPGGGGCAGVVCGVVVVWCGRGCRWCGCGLGRRGAVRSVGWWVGCRSAGGAAAAAVVVGWVPCASQRAGGRSFQALERGSQLVHNVTLSTFPRCGRALINPPPAHAFPRGKKW